MISSLSPDAGMGEIIEKLNEISSFLNQRCLSCDLKKKSLSTIEAADELGCGRDKIYGLIQEGKLLAFHLSRRGDYRIRVADLYAYIAENRAVPD